MPQVTAPITPAHATDYPVLDDAHIKGGFRVLSTVADLALVPTSRRKAGMRVYVAETNIEYALMPDLATWIVSAYVLTTPQNLSTDQQVTARANIQSAATSDTPGVPWIMSRGIVVNGGTSVPGGPAAGTVFGMDSPVPPHTKVSWKNEGNQGKARQSGLIYQVQFFVPSTLHSTTKISLQWWRREHDRWDLVADTGDLRSLVTANNTVQTVTLPFSVKQQIGDDYGGTLEYTGVAGQWGGGFAVRPTPWDGNSLYTVQNLRLWYSPIIESGVDWDVVPVLGGQTIPITALAQSPVLTMVGDSRLAGYPTGHALFQPTTHYERANDIAYLVEVMTGFTAQNYGIAGNTTTQMSGRFAADVLATSPRIAGIFMGGHNDLVMGPIPQATTIANVLGMVDDALAAGCLCFVASDWPFRLTPAEDTVADKNAYNALSDDTCRKVEAALADYDQTRVLWIDLRKNMGVERPITAEPAVTYWKARNRWDLAPAFAFEDQLHLSIAGSYQSARIVSSALMRWCRTLNAQLPQSVNPPVMYTTSPTTETLTPLYPNLPAVALRISGGEYKTWSVGTQAWL